MTQPLDATESERQRMLLVNEQQRSFYEKPPGARGNPLTKLWRRGRSSMMRVREDLQIAALIQQRHLEWLGQLEGKRVLDLGCYAGNALSLDIAAQCGFYVGIDLSEPAIEQLRQKLRACNLPHAHAYAMDFLAVDFPFEPFDVIYAKSVMHHFEHFATFLQVLRERLVPGGRVITFDPMQTAWSVGLARKLYRPFQTDADWEWPFSRHSFRQIEQYFHIEAIQGVMGYTKWVVPIAMMPGGHGLARRLVRRLHEHDLQEATRLGSGLWRCMQVAMHLRRRD